MKRETWTSEEYRQHVRKAEKRANKYHARKTEAGGRVFDSRKEARTAGELRIQQQAGEITTWIPQVSLPLSPGSRRRYRADFLILKPGWEEYVEFVDVKGRDTPQSKLKRDLLEENYGIRVKVK